MLIRPVCTCLRSRQTRPLSTNIKQLLETPFGSDGTAATASTTVHGWIKSHRRYKNITFLALNDGSTHRNLQVVLRGSDKDEPRLTFGAGVTVTGTLQTSKKGTESLELDEAHVTVLGSAPSDNPLQKKFSTAVFLRDHLSLRSRTQLGSAMARIQSRLMMHHVPQFFHAMTCFQVQPPIISSSDCEGAGQTFTIADSLDFYGRKAGLIVSSQLHLEAMAHGLSRVWTITPTFRAEPSTTARHLAEFRMLEAEFCWIETLASLMDVVEELIKSLSVAVSSDTDVLALRTLEAENVDHDVDLPQRWRSIQETAWARITYHQAIEILQTAHAQGAFTPVPEMHSGLRIEHEIYLATQHFRRPVFVTHYPMSQKPFYMLPGSSDTAECFDLLVPSMGELCGGSLREHDYEKLISRMRVDGMDEKNLAWYTELRKYGSAPHGGFGIGWERLIAYLCGISNVREVAAFPRWFNHCVS